MLIEGLAWPPKKEDLERMYLVEKLSAAKIAKAYGLKYKTPKVAESTILYQLKRNGIARRDKADHTRKVTQAMEDEWVRRYQAGESLKQIAHGELSPVTVLLHLRKRGVKLRDKVEAQIDAVTKYARRPFDGDEVEKAYLIGLRYGDLDVVRHGRAIRVRVSTTHPAMASLFRALFSPHGQIHRYPRESKFAGFEWTLEIDLDVSFDFLLPKPQVGDIESLSDDCFVAFLAGFFDAEGSIYLHWKRYGYSPELNVTNTNDELLTLIARRLTQMGFNPTLKRASQREGRGWEMPSGIIFQLNIWRFAEVLSLLRTLSLRHPEKVAKQRLVARLVLPAMQKTNVVVWNQWESLLHRIREGRDNYVALAGKTMLENSQNANT